MPLLNSFYACLLALATYGTVDFKNYTLLSINNQGYSFYVDESKNYCIGATIDNHMIAYNQTVFAESSTDVSQFFIGLQSSDDVMIAGINGYIIQGTNRGVKSDKNCEIEGLWVDEKYRNKGLGTFLLHQAEQYALQQKCVAVSLRTYEIDQAHTFFESRGFDDLVAMPSPHGLQGHAIYLTMKKRLNSATHDAHQYIATGNSTYNGYTIYRGYPLMDGNIDTFPAIKTLVATCISGICKTDKAKNHVITLNKKLKNHREQRGASRTASTFTIFIVSPDKKIIGGAIGEIERYPDFGNWCNVIVVCINEKYRKYQLGRELFKQVDAYALSKQCTYAELWTGEWQARGFYEKVGFSVVATFPRSEHSWNQEGYILKKSLC